MITIREETAADYRAVEALTREAFWNVYRPGCTEHFVLHKYRDDEAFVKPLSLVLEEDGRMVGHVMFSQAEVRCADGRLLPIMTFGPISIHPDCQRRGYGLKLLSHALAKARTLGCKGVCMEGNIDFYKHAGFVVASTLGVHYHDMPHSEEVPFFLAQELEPGYFAGIDGEYMPPKGYFVAEEHPDEFAAYESTFPRREKLRLPTQLFEE